MTQWFFGPPVIDRGFVITGGKCERIVSGVSGAAAAGAAQVDGEVAALETVLTAAACKAAGGAWTGGHDVSGHVFMLVLATGVLGLEVMGVAGSAVYKSVSLGSSSDEEDKENDGGDEGEKVQVWALRFVLGVVGLGWWMLFMTAIWFHTWLEKVSLFLFCLYERLLMVTVVWIDACVGHALCDLFSSEKGRVVEGYCGHAGCLDGHMVTSSRDGVVYICMLMFEDSYTWMVKGSLIRV